ncbi:thiamine-phosphate synthase [Rhodobiaceae bacterium]|nr:thiamine-phosphate synthase [Rhodobiaceae bacterium]
MLTDAARDIDPFQQLTRLKSTDALLYRHYEWPRSDRLALARVLRKTCKENGTPFLVAGDYRLACEVEADGLHLPSWATKRGRNWTRQIRPGWIVTAAAHSEVEIRSAALAGAAAVLISPVFETESHPGAKPLGVMRFAQLAASAAMPVYALGGVTSGCLRRLAEVPNLSGWATVSAI